MAQPTSTTTTTKMDNLGMIRLNFFEVNRNDHEQIGQQILNEINGVLSCKFLGETNEILISFDRNLLNEKNLIHKIEDFGYKFELERNDMVECELRIEGMHCNSCVSNICDAVLDLNGTIDIQLTFLDKLAKIIFDPNLIHLNQIIQEIQQLHFQVAISSPPKTIYTNEIQQSDDIDDYRLADETTPFTGESIS